MGPDLQAPDDSAGASITTPATRDVAWYRLLLDHAADIMLVLDADLRTTWVSSSADRLLGWPTETLVGDTRWDLIHPVDLAAATHELGRLADRETDVASIRLRLRHRQGSYRWWRATARRADVPAAPTTGSTAPHIAPAAGIIITFNDIDEAVRAADREQVTRSRFAAAMDAMLDPFVQLEAVRDAAGEIVDFVQVELNQAACTFYGRTRESTIGLPIRAVLTRVPHVVGLVDRLIDVVDTGRPLVLDEAEAPDPAGRQPRWYEIRAVKAGDGVSLTFRDVTQRTRSVQDLAASERRYRILTESMRDVVWVLDAETLQLLYMSPSVEALRGFTAEEVLAAPFDDAFAPGAADAARAFLAAQVARLRAGDQPFDDFILQELEQPRRDGSTVWTEVIGRFHLNEETGHVEVWAVSRDISERRDTAQSLAASEERYRLLAEHSSDVVLLITFDGRIEWVSPACERTLGWRQQELLGRRNIEFVHPDDLTWFVPRMQRMAAEHGGGLYTLRIRRGDGGYRWMEAASDDVPATADRPAMRVVRLRDVDAQVTATTELRYLATHDALTELVNRRELVHEMTSLLAHRTRTGTNVGVLFLDVDDLKSVNDSRGHAVGDLLIREVARRVAGSVRRDDVVARFGGDEFVVVLPAVHALDDVLAIATKVHAAMAEPVQIPGDVLSLSLSIGAALARPGDDPDAVFHRADAALYEAKRRGRGATAVAAS